VPFDPDNIIIGRFVDERPVLQCMINGKGPIDFLIDTGSFESVTISDEDMKKYDLILSNEGRLLVNGGVFSGKESQIATTFSEITSGNVILRNIKGTYGGYCSTVGMNFLKNFILIMEYGERVILVPAFGKDNPTNEAYHLFLFGYPRVRDRE